MGRDALAGIPLATDSVSVSVTTSPATTPAPHIPWPLFRRQAGDRGAKPYPTEITESTFAWYYDPEETGTTERQPFIYTPYLEFFASSESYLRYCASGESINAGTTTLYRWECPPARGCTKGWLTIGLTTSDCGRESMQCYTDIYYLSRGARSVLSNIGCQTESANRTFYIDVEALSQIVPAATEPPARPLPTHRGSSGRPSSSQFPLAMIVAIVIGIFVFLLIGLCIFFSVRQRRKRRKEKKAAQLYGRGSVAGAIELQTGQPGTGGPPEAYGYYAPPAVAPKSYVRPTPEQGRENDEMNVGQAAADSTPAQQGNLGRWDAVKRKWFGNST